MKKASSVLCAAILLSSLAANIPSAAQPAADAFGVDEDAYGVPGGYTIVPVNITNVYNAIYAIRFDIIYNASIINVTNVSCGDLTSGWVIVYNVMAGVTRVTLGTPGTVSPPIQNQSTGAVALINFSVNAAPGMKSILNFSNIELSDEQGNLGTAPPKNATFHVLKHLPSPFLVHGYVFYENGTACDNPSVNITNTNTSGRWGAITSGNYYQCMLTAGFDVNASEILRFDARSPDDAQRMTLLHEVTAHDINNGSLLMNISLEAFHDVFIEKNYTGAYGTGIRIDNATSVVPPSDNLTAGETYFIKYKVVNNGTSHETVNITVTVSNETSQWEIANYSEYIEEYHLGNVTWDTSSLSPSTYNITVSAYIPNDAYPADNMRNRTVILEAPIAPQPEIISWHPPESIVNDTEGETRTFNITVNQIVDVRWLINGTEVFNESGVSSSAYTNTSAVAGLWNVTAIAENENGSDSHAWIWRVNDITPPGSITNLSYTNGMTWINWTWDDPVDADFSHVLVYIDGEFKANVSKGICHYNATGFGMGTTHTISTRTADIYGNINRTWVNLTASTLPDVTPPVTTVTISPEMPASGWWSENVTITFSRYDPSPGTGVNFTRYAMEGAEGKSWTTVYGDNDFSDIVGAEGMTTVYYYSVDNASNNESEALGYMPNVTVRIDKTPPEIIEVVLEPDVVNVGGTINVTVNLTDALSGVSEVTADGEPLTNQDGDAMWNEQKLSEDVETWKGKITAPSTPGVYNITIVAEDNAGNSATNDTTRYTVAVHVKISGETGEVNCSMLPLTMVALYDGDEMIANTTSDDHGNYTIEAMLPDFGDYRLMASKKGYMSENLTISVETSGEYERDFVAEYGLIPECPSWDYLVECIEHFLLPPTSPCYISFGKLIEVMTAYVQCQNPRGIRAMPESQGGGCEGAG